MKSVFLAFSLLFVSQFAAASSAQKEVSYSCKAESTAYFGDFTLKTVNPLPTEEVVANPDAPKNGTVNLYLSLDKKTEALEALCFSRTGIPTQFACVVTHDGSMFALVALDTKAGQGAILQGNMQFLYECSVGTKNN